MLEMIIKIVQEARLAKATFNMASDSNSEWNWNWLIGLVIDYDWYMTNNNNLITAFLGIAIFLLIVSTVIMYALMNATAKKSSKSKDGNKSSDKSHQQV